jgi:hypothetical protein
MAGSRVPKSTTQPALMLGPQMAQIARFGARHFGEVSTLKARDPSPPLGFYFFLFENYPKGRRDRYF